MLALQPDSNPLEALAALFVEQHRRGEAPSVEEYALEHPELAAQIRELFPTIATLELSWPSPNTVWVAGA